MKKSLVSIFLGASFLMAGGSSTLCFAAEAANPMAAGTPEAVSPQLSQRKMRHLSKRKKHHLSQRKMHRMQRHRQHQSEAATAPSQGRAEDASAPSQRSMRQKMKAATPGTEPTAPAPN
jgi:hypothetical protein